MNSSNSIIVKDDNKYNFRSVFNTETGLYMRTGILREDGKDTGEDPFMASFPELIDIGIMGSCKHGLSGLCKQSGVQCYQNGINTIKPNMGIEEYKGLIDECAGKTFQVALGGRGDVDQHSDFEDILKYTREKGIVPNFTTSGLGLTKEKIAICKQYCGAVAVSWYSRLEEPELALRNRAKEGFKKIYRSENDIPVLFTLGGYSNTIKWDAPSYVINEKTYEWDEMHHMYYSDIAQTYEVYRVYNEVQDSGYTMQAVQSLVEAGVNTNIHYVLSNSSIDEAIIRLKYGGFPKGINAVIFLIHKPVGLGEESNVLKINDPRVIEFFNIIDRGAFEYKIGFDSCTVPGILNLSKSVNMESIETCEAARWSMYISSDMQAMPCSFDNQDMKYAIDLKQVGSIQAAWDSNTFEQIRDKFKHRCKECSVRGNCLGGCPLMEQVVLCNSSKRTD